MIIDDDDNDDDDDDDTNPCGFIPPPQKKQSKAHGCNDLFSVLSLIFFSLFPKENEEKKKVPASFAF